MPKVNYPPSSPMKSAHSCSPVPVCGLLCCPPTPRSPRGLCEAPASSFLHLCSVLNSEPRPLWLPPRAVFRQKLTYLEVCRVAWGHSLVVQMVKNLPAMWETWVRSLDREDPLEKGMATHSSICAWRILWPEEPGGLQFMGSQRAGQD